GRKIVADVSRRDPRVAPVPGNADFVDHLTLDKKRLKALGDQGVDLDGAPGAAHNYAIAALDPFALGVRGADFDEGTRHKTHEPGHVAAHGAGLPVFRNPVGCGDDGESIGFAVAIEFGGLPDLGAGIRLSL